MNVKALIPLLMLVAAVGGAIPVYYDDLLQVFESWRSGEPRALIVLDIRVPQVDADRCVLTVLRYPSMYLPNNGTLERLYRGVVPPGSTVAVRKFIPAIPVKMRYDEARGSYVVDYYEPQEFLVMVHCVKDNTTVFKFGRNVEVYPRNVVHREVIDIAALAERHGREASARQGDVSTLFVSDAREIDGGGGSGPMFSCDIIVTETSWDSVGSVWRVKGYCVTYVAGPYLYSLNGMQTQFGLDYIAATGKASAVYIESFYDTHNCIAGSKGIPDWKSAGKKLVPSRGKFESYPPLIENSKVRIYFQVTYIYEYEIWYDIFSGVGCMEWWTLYPFEVGAVVRADIIGAGFVEPYTPPSPPPYAYLTYGSSLIGFNRNPYVSDYSLAVSSVSFSFTYTYPASWSVTLTVNFYKAGRDDGQYGTPYVKVEPTSLFGYYWWYKDNDAMTYEVLFAPR